MCLLHRKHWLFCVDRVFRAAFSLSVLICWDKSRFIIIVAEVTTSTSTTTTLSSSVSLSRVWVDCLVLCALVASWCNLLWHSVVITGRMSTNRLIMAVNFHFGFVWFGHKKECWNESKMQNLHKNSWRRPIWSWTLWTSKSAKAMKKILIAIGWCFPFTQYTPTHARQASAAAHRPDFITFDFMHGMKHDPHANALPRTHTLGITLFYSLFNIQCSGVP